MAKVRILGPRERQVEVVRALQDIGLVHLSGPGGGPFPGAALSPVSLTRGQEKERRNILRILQDVESVLTQLEPPTDRSRGVPGRPTVHDLARWARMARLARRTLDCLREQSDALEEERALALKYRVFFSAFESLLRSQARWPNASAYHVILRPAGAGSVDELRQALRALLGDEIELRPQPLPGGETALMILVPSAAAGRVERVLAEARVQEIPVPASYGGRSLAEAIPRMLDRLEAIPRELEAIHGRRRRLVVEHGAELQRARGALHDRLSEIDALPLARTTAHAFVIEGWLPQDAAPLVERRLGESFGETVAVIRASTEEWAAEEAPVILSNPRLLRPFETLLRLLPLPRYGSIDPTPFVAVFFPMFFGLILGDVAYGLMLAALGLVLHRRTRPGSTLRAVSEIAGACALFSIIFGVLYGEFLGDLGRRLWGVRPLLLNREEAIVPFLGLTVALGAVHVFLGLGLGLVAAVRRQPRHAVGRGVSIVMLLLILGALLAAADILPRSFFTPSVVSLLVAFPVLVILEGLMAPVEFLSYLGNMLSYARVMALGTASVMLAVVANRMIGALGSASVGILFALLFHLVNFALGLFTPVIHALRLHYVEFFGKFYSPGGARYRPFGHWSPDASQRA